MKKSFHSLYRHVSRHVRGLSKSTMTIDSASPPSARVPEPIREAVLVAAREAQTVEGQSSHEKAVERLFELAKTRVGWPEIRGYLTRHPEAARWRGNAWNETLLHWAAISDLGAAGDLLTHGIIDEADSQGRRPVDWAIERLLFTLEEQKKLKIDEREMRKLRDLWEGSARLLASSGASLNYPLEEDNGYGLMDLALRAGAAQAVEGFLLAGERKRMQEQPQLLGRWLRAWTAGLFSSENERLASLHALMQGQELTLAGEQPVAGGATVLRAGVMAWLRGELIQTKGLRLLVSTGSEPEAEGPDGREMWEDVEQWIQETHSNRLETIQRVCTMLGLDHGESQGAPDNAQSSESSSRPSQLLAKHHD